MQVLPHPSTEDGRTHYKQALLREINRTSALVTTEFFLLGSFNDDGQVSD
jgi:hypothetical protein